MSNLFRPFISNETEKLQFLKYHTIGKHRNAYFDYTASGLAFRPIENRVFDVLTTYANTHSKESSMAYKTHMYYEQALQSLKSSLELNDEFEVLPAGCGATGAIKKMQELLGLYIPPATLNRFGISVAKKKLPLIIVGPYEHHSNEVSYREALCEVQRIGLNDKGLVDLRQLKELLQENRHREIIGCFCIASNVTGIITPYEEISKLLRSYGATVCFDAAASSPYMNVDCNLYDVLFLSPHKLLGGPGSCGLLIIKKDLINTTIAPSFAGGGTVTYVNKKEANYAEDINSRETAGTPGILQLIRAALAYQLRNEIGFEFIEQKKQALFEHCKKRLKEIENCHIYGNEISKNIGILSFNIGSLDPYALCDNLSNEQGFQTRAGCSCAGPYGHDLLGLKGPLKDDERPGWLRVSIHYSQTIEEIDELIDALKSSIKSL